MASAEWFVRRCVALKYSKADPGVARGLAKSSTSVPRTCDEFDSSPTGHKEMLAITTPTYANPSAYQLSTVAKPEVTDPTEVVIQVHAASINPVDVKKANGALKLAISDEFPYSIGYDCAGVVVATGNAVTRLKTGDSIYTRLPEEGRGAWSEYAKSPEQFVALKPNSLSFSEAASLPLAAMTALQALRKYKGSLEGKTVFIPAGLSGTGAYACQLAKNVFKAGRVITTVSTSKVDLIAGCLGEGVVDQVIDYTKQKLSEAIPAKSVDFVFDTTGEAMQYLSLMVPSTSSIVSIATLPSGKTLQASDLMQRPGQRPLPWVFRTYLDIGDAVRKFRARRWSVDYDYFLLDPNARDLDTLSQYVEDKRLRPVVGTRADFHDIGKVREACWQVFNGKGGLGKAVIEVIQG